MRVLKLSADTSTIFKMPVCSTVLSVGIQRGNPVIWFEEPDLEKVGYEPEAWPTVDVVFDVVPTGNEVKDNMVFVGTVQRPRRSDPTRYSVVHVYMNRSKFINFR